MILSCRSIIPVLKWERSGALNFSSPDIYIADVILFYKLQHIFSNNLPPISLQELQRVLVQNEMFSHYWYVVLSLKWNKVLRRINILNLSICANLIISLYEAVLMLLLFCCIELPFFKVPVGKMRTKKLKYIDDQLEASPFLLLQLLKEEDAQIRSPSRERPFPENCLSFCRKKIKNMSKQRKHLKQSSREAGC